MVSSCCKDNVFVVHGNESTSFYACEKCHMACDILFSMKSAKKDLDNDPGHEVKTTSSFDSA